ncbi:MAG: flagellin FliC3 [Roseburia sp.]|nr:flagellin FliC3 [Roseburia sp.]MCM1099233.1 flagellin FliC3 [Ruminococcus flavefaciens]
MRINYNVSAMLSNNALANNDKLLSQSLERLSSGLKINRAKDNPAGLAMAKRMNAQIEGLSVANQNSNDGISIIEIADGAMNEISEMLQRINELAIKSANGTMSESDRATVQDEVSELKEEIQRISDVTEFNGQQLLNGEFGLKGYVYGNLDVKVSDCSKEVPTRPYEIESLTLMKEMIEGEPTGEYMVKDISLGEGFTDPDGIKTKMDGDLLTLSGPNNFEITLDLTGLELETALAGDGAELEVEDLTIDVTGMGAMTVQVGANEGQVLEIEIPAVSLRNMGIEKLDVSTAEGALQAIVDVDGAVRYVSAVRGRLGAYQNRLESTVKNLDVSSENMTAAYSRIMDVDMADEMTQYTTYQVLTQAGTSMLAQANQRPSQVLQLLQ